MYCILELLLCYIFFSVGILIYVMYGYHHSVTGQMNQTDASVGYRVLQNDSSSQEFTGALYGTIERQQPERKDESLYDDEDHAVDNAAADYDGNRNIQEKQRDLMQES